MSSNLSFDSYAILKNIPLPSSTETFNDNEKENKPILGYKTIGGILLNLQYVWKAKGSQFTLFNLKSGIKVSSWNFGSLNLTVCTKVTCVAELQRHSRKLPLLIIGLERGTHGQVCIFDFTVSRLLRSIDIDYQVTSLSVIDQKGDVSLLTKDLDIFDGIVVVGTSDGNVFLLDICQSEYEDALINDASNEINACEVEVLYPNEINLLDVNSYRGSLNKRHLLLHLNATSDNVEHFVLKGPKGDNRLFVNKEEVIVSALHYCPQLASLLVGYNFGAWQLWNFTNMELTYTSPVYQDNVAVSHFAVQEPCDDPRAFCYVWTVYSNADPFHQGIPIAVLYSLNYERKSFYEGHGILYKSLTSCTVRFQIVLTNNENDISNEQVGINCLRLQVINKNVSKSSFGTTDDVTTVCALAWNEWNLRTQRQCKTYLNLFDLNQWYKEQMPSILSSKNCESFTSRVCLSDMKSSYPLLDVQINEESLYQFHGSQKLEEHYHPSSLAFQTYSLSDNSVTIFSNQGKQRSLMSSLELSGPSILLKPTDTFLQAVNLGLTPLFMDTPNKITTPDYQREFILSVALEQQLLGWLCKCVSVWSSGIYDAVGCSLNFLLTWSMQRAKTLKENADRLITTLFDYTGFRLDDNTQNLLCHCLKQFRSLSMLFKFVVRKYLGFVLNPDVIKFQSDSLEMVFEYFEVLHWFLNVGLLPECPLSSYPKTDEFNRIFVPYPVEKLIEYYNERRTDLNMFVKEKLTSRESILFIDNLIERECGGQHLQQQWENDGGSGTYPPVSLQALLRTYLVENIPIALKHHIVAYLLMDLAMLLEHDRYESTITHLLKFPFVFHMSPSAIKIIQSFWQLDHGNFEAAVETLLDPMISANDLQLWHHRLILKALFVQDQFNFALLYLQVRRPAVEDVDDLCTIISLYVTNNLIDAAFHFQRQHQSTDALQKLLHHFYKECDKIKSIKSVLFLPLQKEEEEAFIKYLKDVNHPEAEDLQVYYYTQRSRYLDAVIVNDCFNSIKAQNKGLHGQQMLTDRDNVISHVQFLSNPFNKSIMDECKKIESITNKNAKPKPFSVFVHGTDVKVKYKSSLIETALVKAKEAWSNPILSKNSAKNGSGRITNDDVPFLCKPRATIPQPKVLTPLIYPKIRNNCEEDDEPPPKKCRLLSRLSVPSVDSPQKNFNVSCKMLSVRLDTPIVRRKLPRGIVSLDGSASRTETPQSILKSQISNLADSFEETDTDETKQSRTNACSSFANRNIPSVSHRSSLGLTPRRPLTYTPKPAVRFSISRRMSDSSQASTSSEPDFQVVQETALIHSTLDGTDTPVNVSPTSKQIISTNDSMKRRSANDQGIQNEKLDEIVDDIDHTPEPPKTPRSRKSYKVEGVRSSPRLHRPMELNTNAELKNTSEVQRDLNSVSQELVCSISEPIQTPRARRSYKDLHLEDKNSKRNLKKSKQTDIKRTSLSRKVLENNTFTKMVEKYSSFSTTLRSSVVNHDKASERRGENGRVTDNFPTEPVSSSSVEQKIEEPSVCESVSIETCEIIKEEALSLMETGHSEDLKDGQLNSEVVPQVKPGDTEGAKEYDQTVKNSSIFEIEKIDSEDVKDEVKTENEVIVQVEMDNAEDLTIMENVLEGNREQNNIIAKEISEVTSTIETEEIVNQINVYDDLSDEVYESADPKMNVFDISDDLNLNEAIFVSIDSAEVETNSVYSANGGEVFADKSDLLDIVPVDESSSGQPDSSSHIETNSVIEKVHLLEPENEKKQPSHLSNMDIIELSSSNEENSAPTDSSVDENYSSTSDFSGDLSVYTDESHNSSEFKYSNKAESDYTSSCNSNENNISEDSNTSKLKITHDENLQKSMYDTPDNENMPTIAEEVEMATELIYIQKTFDNVQKSSDDVENMTCANIQTQDISIQSTTLISSNFDNKTFSTLGLIETTKSNDILDDNSLQTAIITSSIFDDKSFEKLNQAKISEADDNADPQSFGMPIKEISSQCDPTNVVFKERKDLNVDHLPSSSSEIEDSEKANNVNILVDKGIQNINVTVTNGAPEIANLVVKSEAKRENEHIEPINNVINEENQNSVNISSLPAFTDKLTKNVELTSGHSETTSLMPDKDPFTPNPVNIFGLDESFSTDILDNTPVLTRMRSSSVNLQSDGLLSSFESPISSSSKFHIDPSAANSTKCLDLSESCLKNSPATTKTRSSSVYASLFSPHTERQSTPVRRSKRVSSLQPEIMDIRELAHTKNMSSSHPNLSNDSLTNITGTESPPAKRKRSSTNVEASTSKRELRGRSVDIELPQTNKRSGEKKKKASSVKNATVTEKSNEHVECKPKKSKSDLALNRTSIEEYSSIRRLTRRQAKVMEQNLSNRNTKLTTPEIENTDMTNSGMDKSSDSPIAVRLRSNNSLSNSDVSTTHSDNVTEKRPLDEQTSKSLSSYDFSSEAQSENRNLPRKLRKRRFNSKDSDSSAISETHSLIEETKPARITRRTRSVTNETVQPTLRRSERTSKRSGLPKILEEPNIEGNVKRRGKKNNN